MKAFLIKYHRIIIFLIVFIPLSLYFVPRQHNYYLNDDIEKFEKVHLTSFLIRTGIVASAGILIFLLVKTKSIKDSGIGLLTAGVTIAFFLFIFHDIILGTALFVNRQFKREVVKKAYIVDYMAGADKTKTYFIPYDISAGDISNDRKLINALYHPGLKQNDTIFLQFSKGLFGITYHSKPLDDD